MKKVLAFVREIATLNQKGISVLLDDRDERAGVKFKDADLYGFPVSIVIGERNLKEECVEFRINSRNNIEKVSVDTVSSMILEVVDTL